MSQKNKNLIEKINEEFFQSNDEFYLNYLAEDIRWSIIGKTTVVGKNNFLREMKMKELDNLPVIKIKNIIAEGEYVVVESEGKTTTKTGKVHQTAYCDIYRMENGKIKEMITYPVVTKKEE